MIKTIYRLDEVIEMQLYNEFGAVEEIVYFIDEDCTDELI